MYDVITTDHWSRDTAQFLVSAQREELWPPVTEAPGTRRSSPRAVGGGRAARAGLGGGGCGVAEGR